MKHRKVFSFALSALMLFSTPFYPISDRMTSNLSIVASAEGFVMRIEAPSTDDPRYYDDNPFYQSGYGLPNCTCYAYGRAWELLGHKPNLSTGNAGKWWWDNINSGAYSYGSTPKLGAIACWDKYDKNKGHVAVVESIDGDNVTLSESHYGDNHDGPLFDLKVMKADGSDYLTSRRFLGYIYIGDFSPVEPIHVIAPSHIDVYDLDHNSLPNRWINEGDDCLVYDTGEEYVKVTYPSPSSPGGTFTAYVKRRDIMPSNSSPRLNIDQAVGGEGTITISGWAFDPDDVNASLDIHVYMDADNKWVGATKCQYDDDSGLIGVIGPASVYKHRFSVTFNTTEVGEHTINIAALDTQGGNATWSGHNVNILPPHAHQYTESITKQPTCTEDGVKTFSCGCGDSYTQAIPKLGHNYEARVTKEPTCAEAGVRTYTCTRCGDSYTEPLTSPPHNFVATITKEPTCVEEGIRTYTCSGCGTVYTEAIPAIGHHSFGDWTLSDMPTHDKDGKCERECTVCHEKETHVIEKLPFKGSGTQEDPYQISSKDDLIAMRDLVNDPIAGYTFCKMWYVQTADIDLDNEQWTPIGKRMKDGVDGALPAFGGNYNGLYHKITNLYVNETEKFAGLFGSTMGDGTIENLIVYGSVSSLGQSVGGICGELCNGKSAVINCGFIGDIHAEENEDAIGGIVGYMWLSGTVKNCYHIGSVTNTATKDNKAVGGIVGRIYVGEHNSGVVTVENCYHIGAVKGAAGVTGAAVGYMSDGNLVEADIYIQNCHVRYGDCNNNIATNGKATFCDTRLKDNSKLKEIAEDLGDAFTSDTKNTNSGYPIFKTISSGVEGDANCDGVFDATDVIRLQKWLLSSDGQINYSYPTIDFDGNGVIDIFDLAIMKWRLINVK